MSMSNVLVNCGDVDCFHSYPGISHSDSWCHSAFELLIKLGICSLAAERKNGRSRMLKDSKMEQRTWEILRVRTERQGSFWMTGQGTDTDAV